MLAVDLACIALIGALGAVRLIRRAPRTDGRLPAAGEHSGSVVVGRRLSGTRP